MKQWYYRLSLQKKILYSELFLFISSFLVLAVFAVLNFHQERLSELSHMKQFNQQLNLNIDTIMESTSPLRYFHLSDNKLRTMLMDSDDDVDPEGFRETERHFTEKLSLLADMGGYVLRANVRTADGRNYENLVENSAAYQIKMQQIAEGISWEKKNQCYFTEVEKKVISQVEYDVISMICRIWDVDPKEPVGTLYLDLDFGKISNQLELLSKGSGDSGGFFILNQEGVLFDSAGEKNKFQEEERNLKKELDVLLEQKQAQGSLTLKGERCFVVASQNGETGWYLVQYIPTGYLTEKIIKNMWVVLLLILAALLAAISGSYFFSCQVSRPVQILSRVMEQVATDGDSGKEVALFEESQNLWEDEIGAMIRSYNAMARRINGNIIQTYQYQLNQKQTELKMLQMQINPHFLYNALNTISAIARLEEVHYIPEIADSLSEMFRYNIKGKDVVTIREELKQLQNYLYIQKIRFPDRFVTEYQVEEELMDCQILKFVFQPIVENAFRYGFVHKKKQDVLKIKVELDGTDILISIEDNGAGMSQEKVKQLNKDLADGQKTKGENQSIGLINVDYRLKNYYGREYGITIESQEGSHTTVRLRIKWCCPMANTGGTVE